MKRVLSSVVGLIGVLFLVGGGIGTLVSLTHIFTDKHLHQGTWVIALHWSLASVLSGWAILASRFLLYGVATILQVGEATSAWVTGHTARAIYGTIVAVTLVAYGWHWLGEITKEESDGVPSTVG